MATMTATGVDEWPERQIVALLDHYQLNRALTPDIKTWLCADHIGDIVGEAMNVSDDLATTLDTLEQWSRAPSDLERMMHIPLDRARPNELVPLLRYAADTVKQLIERGHSDQLNAFRRRASAERSHKLSVNDLIEALAPAISAWQTQATIRIADHPPGTLNSESAATTQAAYQDGVVTLYAANIASLAEAEQVLRHEIVGHIKMPALLGSLEYDRLLDRVTRMVSNPSRSSDEESLIAEVRRRYPRLDKSGRAFAQEVIAVACENPQPLSWLDKARVATRRFMRQAGLYRVEPALDRRELDYLIAKAGVYRDPLPAHRGDDSERMPRARLDPAVYSQTAPVYYSKMREVLSDKLPERGPADKMAEAISSYAEKGQFKKAELDWSGVLQWLDEQGTERVTRGAVIQAFDAGSVHLETVTLTTDYNTESAGTVQLRQPTAEEQARYFPSSRDSEEEFQQLIDSLRETALFEYATEVNAITEHDVDQQEVERRARNMAHLELEKLNAGKQPMMAQLHDHVIPYNVRNHSAAGMTGRPFAEVTRYATTIDEVAIEPHDLTRSHIEANGVAGEPLNEHEVLERIRHDATQQFKAAVPGFTPAAGSVRWQRYTPFHEQAENYRETLLCLPNHNEGFISSHWLNQTNVLVHLRTDYRAIEPTEPGSKPALFIDEIQSDWHQAGRRRGYGRNEQQIQEALDQLQQQIIQTKANITAACQQLRHRVIHVRDIPIVTRQRMARTIDSTVSEADYSDGDMVYSDFYQMATSIGLDQVNDEGVKGAGEHLASLISELNDIRIQKRGVENDNRHAVPAAPFEKTWHMLGVKQAIRMACDAGLDRVAWTTGELSNLTSGGNSSWFYDRNLKNDISKYVRKFGSQVSVIQLAGVGEVPTFEITEEMREAARIGQPLFSRADPESRTEVEESENPRMRRGSTMQLS
jgi:glycerophosphoryl diester phosphodiesterase